VVLAFEINDYHIVKLGMLSEFDNKENKKKAPIVRGFFSYRWDVKLGKESFFIQPMVITHKKKMEISLEKNINELFANPKSPLQVDLGMGSGKFIKQAAKRYRNINWIGVKATY